MQILLRGPIFHMTSEIVTQERRVNEKIEFTQDCDMNCEENHYNNDHDTPFNRSDEEIGILDDQSNVNAWQKST